MYNNVGQKIENLASAIAVLGIILGVIVGIWLIINIAFIVGLLYIVVSAILSWLGSLLLYGFGELIYSTTGCHEILYQMLQRTERVTAEQNENAHTYGKTTARQNENAHTYERIPTWKRIEMERAAKKAKPANGTYCTVCGANNSTDAKF